MNERAEEFEADVLAQVQEADAAWAEGDRTSATADEFKRMIRTGAGDNIDRCVMCRRNPAAGFAFIGNNRYCHGDDTEGRTCYERAQNPWEFT